MRQFLELIDTVLTKGKKRATSVQGPGTIVYPGYQMRFRPAEEFPLITTRSMKGSWRAMVHELLWFLSGSDDTADLHKHGVHLWDPWATPEICAQYGLEPGKVGPIYGPQWRRWRKRENETVDRIAALLGQNVSAEEKVGAIVRMLEGRPQGGYFVDQISQVVDEIKTSPDSKRMKVVSWNPEDVDRVFVAPCHGDFKFIVAEGELYLNLWQRSADILIGVPFNMAGYGLLLLMVAQVTGLKPAEFIHQISDAHIYYDQLDYARIQLSREPRPLPKIVLNPKDDNLLSFTFGDFKLEGYDPHPPIKGIPVGV